MLYAILCYESEEFVGSWSKEKNDTLMARLFTIQEKLHQSGKMGPVARLMPTTTATTVRSSRETVVIDGPFAETKEQLLGFYMLDCESLEEALDVAKELAHGSGALEVRPVMTYKPWNAARE